MPPRSDPTARQERLGRELRRLREAAGLTGRRAAALIGTTPMQVSHMETGRSGVSEERLRLMASHYGCSDGALLDALVRMAGERGRGWWESYRGLLGREAMDLAELESGATHMRVLQSAHVPGLLQTEAHVRALLSYGSPALSPRQLEERVEFRVRRQEVLRHENAPDLTAIIHEAPLRIRVADRAVARAQLVHLLEVSELPNVTVRVIPFDLDGFGGAGLSMLYAGGEVPRLDTVQLDAPYGLAWLDAEAQLRRYRETLDKVEEVALAVPQSRDHIREIHREL
ncbi:DNA-binding protein [Wenjunlia vitaminophila]|uniref:DNA-binding protein n=1 Tax=Wenjunlia vitaminophila TaxID=76728 RepID=A0A0T6LNS7_WENVI|nr:helix-turn-helix transcriptional regulator [Wenjunlia vitaminophila]KRV47751.1 DNA-binding protein [Wenjunlia vitaminophila]